MQMDMNFGPCQADKQSSCTHFACVDDVPICMAGRKLGEAASSSGAERGKVEYTKIIYRADNKLEASRQVIHPTSPLKHTPFSSSPSCAAEEHRPAYRQIFTRYCLRSYLTDAVV
jgi:hypothetical protein